WRDVKAVLMGCVDAAIEHRPVSVEIERLAHQLKKDRNLVRDRGCHNWFEPASYIYYVLADLVAAQNNPTKRLRYPDFRLRRGVEVKPVYEQVACFIDRLDRARQSVAGDTAEPARTELIRARDGPAA